MCSCFATGSRKMENNKPALVVLDYIEYILYDFENHQVFVTGDFFVQNNSSNRQRLYGLHRGNIEFSLSTDKWLTDTQWTKILDNVAGLKIGLEITKQGKVLLHKIIGPIIEVELVTNANDFSKWGPEIPADGTDSYFSAWQSPELESGKCSLIRVTGIIEGDTYHKLLPEGHNKIIITGGVPLLTEIERELQKNDLPNHGDYQAAFNDFKGMFQPMNFYNVFFEGTGGEEFKFINGSTDIHTAKSNMEIDERRINWYWSRTDHYEVKTQAGHYEVNTQAKGPLLILAKA